MIGRVESRGRQRSSELASFAVVAVAAVLLAVLLLELWRADIHVPFMYDGDGLSTSVQVKGMMENGWFLSNPRIGAPMGLDMRDFPTPDVLQVAIMKLLALFADEYAVVMNVYYLLTFPLTAVVAFAVLRRWRVSRMVAGSVSLLYAFLPYHIQKAGSMGQLYLASYFLIPLIVWLAVESMGRPLLLRDAGERRGWLTRERVAVLLICAAAGACGIYYAYFGAILIAVAGVSGWVRSGDARLAVSAAMVIIVLVTSVAVAVSPSILARASLGPNPEALERAPVESDLWGLRVAQLLLPVDGHRIPIFARLKHSYLAGLAGWASWLAIGENITLGAVGAVGLLWLFAWLVTVRRRQDLLGSQRWELTDRFGSLLATCIFIGSVGAIGALIGFAIPEIRVYARMFVYVAFLCLAAMALLMDRLLERLSESNRGTLLRSAILIGVLLLGLLDQVPPAILPDYASTAHRWASDAEIVAAIESELPTGSMVFQLPYMGFPEATWPYPGTMNDYDHFRAYLHSGNLKWSYGSMKGREADVWQREVAALPVEELIDEISGEGFRGVWVNRDGYADSEALLRELTLSLGEPILSEDGRVAFYEIR